MFRFLAEFTSRASTLITFPLFAKYLGAEGYGVNIQINTIISFLVPITTLGLGYAVVRLIAGSKERHLVSSHFYTSLVVVGFASAILSLWVFLLSPLLNSSFIKVDWAPQIIRWSAPLVFLSAIEATIKDYYRARLRIISYSVFQILQSFSYVFGVALILINSGNLLQVIWLWLGIKFLFNITTFAYFIFIKEIDILPSFLLKKELTSLLQFGFPLVIASLGTWVINISDRWVIGHFLSITNVAIYSAAYSLAGVITALAAPFWNPLYPVMSTFYNKNDLRSLFSATRKYTNGFSIITIPSVAGLIVIANPLLILLGSSDFSIQSHTFALIILGLFFDQFSASMHYLIYLHNEPYFMRNVLLTSSIFNVVMNLITVPWFGITGAALSTFITYLFLDVLLLKKVVSYQIDIRDVYDFKTTGVYSISSFIMALFLIVGMRWVDTSLISIVKLILFGVFMYVFMLLFFYKFSIRKIVQSV